MKYFSPSAHKMNLIQSQKRFQQQDTTSNSLIPPVSLTLTTQKR